MTPRMLFIEAWLVLAKLLAWIVATCFCVVVLAEPNSPAAAKAAVSDATVQARKDAKPALPDTLKDSTGIYPKPATEPLPPAPEQSTGNASKERNAPVDARPVVHFYHTARCPPCDVAEAALRKAGIPLYVPTKPPKWVDTFPTMAWQVGDEWHYHFGWQGLALFIADYAPKRVEIAAAPPSAVPLEQVHRFIGDEGTFVFTPKTPVKATMQDGSQIAYSRVTGSWKASDQALTIKLDQPLPVATVHYWGFAVAAQILGAASDGQSVTISTSKGTKKISIRLEDAK